MTTSTCPEHKNPRGWKTYAVGAAVLTALLASTACESDGNDGPGDAKATDRPSATGAPTPGTGSATPDRTGPATPGGTGSVKPGGGSGDTGGSDAGGDGDAAAVTACAGDALSFSATNESQEGEAVRHLLLTVTNVGDKKCNVHHYPEVWLGSDAQAPVAVIKDSDPQALATLAPGAEAYAAVLVSGGARDTYEADSITLGLQDREPGSTVGDPIDVDLPGVDSLTADDGARVTYWMTASGLALRFVTSA
ncbi:DUF4232 domain-containing protein [Streptomyces sp. NPDC018031]|uniref:DUF4232 domain-containing protein n=1 Tax=Streptomyces sp. NPDC018031 TaxID=3365033 RepID=UPI0037A97741